MRCGDTEQSTGVFTGLMATKWDCCVDVRPDTVDCAALYVRKNDEIA